MRNRFFKLVSITLIFSLIFSSAVYSVSATDGSAVTGGTCGEALTWSFDESTGTLTVDGSGDMTDYTNSSDVPWYDVKNNITALNIAYGVTGIGNWSFDSCVNLTDVNMPESVTRIGSYAFSNCDTLTAVTIPSTVSKIDTCAFIDCNILSELTICEGVASIGAYAFSYCPNLKSVFVPDSVANLENEIFYYCEGLETVHFGKNSPLVDMTMFVECHSLKSVNVDPENPNMTNDENGVLFNKDKTTLLVYPMGKEETNYIIPYGVENIGLGAFNFAVSLTSIDMPETLKSIGSNGFYACENLTNIHIPDTVSQIGDLAFSGCYKLTSIALPKALESMGYQVFASSEKIQSIFIPSCVTKIEKYTFVLSDCISDIYYDADEEAWEKVAIENHNGSLTKATVHFNHEHTHEITDEKNPTCEESGYKKYSCTVCPHHYTEYIAESGHDFGEYIPDENTLSETAACQNEGCDETFTREYQTTSGDKHNVSASYSPDCFNEEITLDVTEITADREPGGIYMVEGKTYKQIGIYNIKAVNVSGETVQPNTGYKVTLKIAIPEAYKDRTDMMIYHRFVDGGREQLSTANGTLKIENGYMIFEVSKFSEFEILLPTASMKLTKQPEKTDYRYRSSTVDLTGIELEVTNPDGTTETVTDTSLLSVSGFNGRIIGTQTVTIHYCELSADIELTVSYTWWQWLIRTVLLGFLWY